MFSVIPIHFTPYSSCVFILHWITRVVESYTIGLVHFIVLYGKYSSTLTIIEGPLVILSSKNLVKPNVSLKGISLELIERLTKNAM